jgi:exodeoxyribonuclease VII small subunit
MTQPESDPTPSFEESLGELQQNVADLEDGALGLEESMQRFERGIALLRRCYATLEQAEQKIEVLTGISAGGAVRTVPFDGTATFDDQQPSAGRRKQAPRTHREAEEPLVDEDEEAPPTLF